jgi:hypothetical protein
MILKNIKIKTQRELSFYSECKLKELDNRISKLKGLKNVKH